MCLISWVRIAFFVLVLSIAPQSAQAALSEYYIGVDGQAAFTSGTYNGLANPNYGRLTLLYNHGNHYHGIGVYSYSGPNLGVDTVVNDTSSNNRLPEISTLQPPLLLTAGSGVYAGKLISQPQMGVDYSNLEMRNTQSLVGDPDDTQGLFNSSSGRWNGVLGVYEEDHQHYHYAHIHLELVSATPGLNVGTLSDPDALSGGDVHLGDGDELFSFTPVLWVAAGAAPGTYTAEFRLVDEHGELGDSGRFFIDTQVVPEPAGAAASLLGLALCALARRRRG